MKEETKRKISEVFELTVEVWLGLCFFFVIIEVAIKDRFSDLIDSANLIFMGKVFLVLLLIVFVGVLLNTIYESEWWQTRKTIRRIRGLKKEYLDRRTTVVEKAN